MLPILTLGAAVLTACDKSPDHPHGCSLEATTDRDTELEQAGQGNQTRRHLAA
jgi:hypothetical protein